MYISFTDNIQAIYRLYKRHILCIKCKCVGSANNKNVIMYGNEIGTYLYSIVFVDVKQGVITICRIKSSYGREIILVSYGREMILVSCL